MRAAIPEHLTRLRMATRAIHKSVEVRTDSDRLLGNAPERLHYQNFLSAHYLLHKQVAVLSAGLLKNSPQTELLDWPECPRILALEDDLLNLGVCIDVSSYRNLPSQTHGFILGLIYVCEGSCIGNQKVLSALSRHPCFNRWGSKEFLTTCKSGFADRWKTLLASMDQLVRYSSEFDHSSYKDLEKGAIAGFDLYMNYWSALEAASDKQDRSAKLASQGVMA